ncbi:MULTISPECIES: GspH/FimT family pseudopilin [unclassified Mesorhizobium]|uniref:prepilin-type N-terminal cleavage/methylation domain-containing protein n=1 Tax=unclassified Mesorhizobium TaxID=325217 RepID=UPI00112A2284|nr:MULTISPECIES: GspH/FimT family pseudopilin [unclassified Mesorhizobium]MBZ9768407.1 prepilin-type N-terminal cleavage/methylation domain-containing protein [Mesorhizobium sp. CA6]TPI71948.1 type II secretion system protein GspH [Mesorhizobium sp. B2-8-9]
MRTFAAVPRHKRGPEHQGEVGFTLIELLVVLAIIAVVAAIAAPGIVQRYRSESLESLSSEIVGRIRMSRTVAIATTRPQQVVIDVGDRTIRFGDQPVLGLPEDMKMSVTTGRETVTDRQTALTFLPDGSSSGVEIDLQRGAQTAHIEVNWLTGLTSRTIKP